MGKGIPWAVTVGPELLTEYAGATIGAYFTDADTQLRTQQIAEERFQEMYGVGFGTVHLERVQLSTSCSSHLGC